MAKKRSFMSKDIGIRPRNDQKVFIVDTNVLLHDRGCIHHFGDNIIVIPGPSISELDRNKKGFEQKAANARFFSRLLRSYIEQGSLREGVRTEGNGTLIVDYNGNDFSGLHKGAEKNNDNRIISIAQGWQKRCPNNQVILVTKDNNMAIMANTLDIQTQDYKSDMKIKHVDELYSGWCEIVISKQDDHLIDELARSEKLDAGKVSQEVLENLFPNQCIRFNSYNEKKYALAIYKKRLGKFIKVPKPKDNAKGIRPRNDLQCFAFALLSDPSITSVTVAGKAGTGKTILSLLAGYNQMDHGQYSRMIVYRPVQEADNSLGFLPGEKEEKFRPYMQPVYDNMEVILDGVERIEYEPKIQPGRKSGRQRERNEKPSLVTLDDYLERGLIQIDPINWIVGRTIPNTFIVFDEGAEWTPEKIMNCGARCGMNSKVVFIGNPNWIINPYLSPESNGLVYLIEKLKNEELAGHITLAKSERSETAQMFASL